MVQTEPTLQAVNAREQTYEGLISSILAGKRLAVHHGLTQLMSTPELNGAAVLLVDTLLDGGTVLVAGNGGSAAEAQHFAAELVGRFQYDRAPIAALALCTDSSILTAVANDYGYEQVFARQVLALGHPGDLLVAFSTSGESENLLRAVAAARLVGMKTLAVTGSRQCPLACEADLAVCAAAPDTPGVQELHMMVTHVLCGIAESELMRVRT